MSFLVKKFIKDCDNVNNLKVRTSYGKLAASVGIISNLVLFATKVTVGLLANSISIIANGVDNLSDMGSSIVTLFGFKMSQRPADSEHPYGHQRIEYIAGLIVSILILYIGVKIGIQSVQRILNPEETVFGVWSIVVLVFSIIVKFFQGRFYRKLGTKINSLTLIATGADSRNDVITTGSVLLGTLFSMLTNINIDGYLGVLVSIFVVISGIQLIKDTTDPLIGVAPDKKLISKITQDIRKHEGVLGTHDLVCHMYGENKCFMSIHVEVSYKEDILKSHDVIDNIEREIKDKYNVELVIHMDPVVVDDNEMNYLKNTIEKLIMDLNLGLSFHDFRLIRGETHTNIIFDVVRPNDCKLSPKEIKTMIQNEVTKIDKRYYTVINFDNEYTNYQD